MLNPLSKLLYFENREKKKETNATTLHAVRTRCASCGDWMCCLCRRHMVYSKKQFLTHWKSQPEKKKKERGTSPVFLILPWYSLDPLCLYECPLLLRSTSSLDFLTRAYRHVRLASCPRHWSWPDTVLYTLTNNPTGATGQLKPIRDQEVMLSQPQDNPLLYNPTCVQLHTCLSSQASDGSHRFPATSRLQGCVVAC